MGAAYYLLLTTYYLLLTVPGRRCMDAAYCLLLTTYYLQFQVEDVWMLLDLEAMDKELGATS